MKVLLVDTKLTGHHLSYLSKIATSSKITPIYLLPEKCSDLNGVQYVMSNNPNSIHGYIRWLKEIVKIAEQNNVDLIHFLYADALYKGFGIGLGLLKKKFKVIGTFHQVRRSPLRDRSRLEIFKSISYGIVHTAKIERYLRGKGINNIEKIEYPKFNSSIEVQQNYARKYFSIPQDVRTFVSLGGTRSDKGLDLLLEALNGISSPFHLLIAGKEESFTEEFIVSKISNYKDKVTVVLKFLSDDEMNLALSAADVVVLPYRKIFDGASGPLAEGVWKRKLILGSNHGSLGDIIERNQLGVTFESENIEDLRSKIKLILGNDLIWNNLSEEYRKQLDPEYFLAMYEKVYLSIL